MSRSLWAGLLARLRAFVVGVTEVTARVRGVASWPTRSAYEALEFAGDAMLDDAEAESLVQASGAPTIGATGAGRDTD